MLHFHRKNVSKGKTGLPGRLTAFGLAAALCASYLLVPPAAAEVDYICGMTEHTHTAACYQRVCGKEEIFSHTHVRECYDEDNHLICTLTERTLHHHSESCYSQPQPICGLEESEEHTHTAECYPADFQPELICGQEDIPEHRHTADCYRLVCALPEHLHAADCVRVVEETTEPEVTEPTEETQEPEVTEPTEETQEPEVTEPTEETQEPEATEPTEETQEPEVTEPTEETQETEATEPTEETQETEATEPTGEPEATEPDTLAAMKNIADVLTVGTLTVTYPKEETVYHLFRVGSMVNGTLVLDEEFSGVSTTDWKRTASVLSEVIQKTGRGTELSQAVVTGGSAVFGGLGEAVYLVMGDETVTNGITDTPVPFLTAMPGTDGQNQPVWDVQAAGEQQETMDISVTKVWVGDRVSGRPASIIVHLTLDGKDYGPLVRLNYANHWSYTWENLPVGNWSVREESSRRYTTTMTREGNTFTFTSTWKKIPQTGQLWWPVAAMSAAGVCLVGAGLLRRRKQDKNA